METSTNLASSQNHTSILVSINATNLPDCINFLIQNKISFSIEYTNNETQQNQVTSDSLKEPSHLYKEIGLLQKEKNHEIARSIFEKYIISVTNKIPPTSKQMAQEYNISVGKLKTIFLELYGKPFYQVYLDTKMQQAAEMLKNGFTSNAISNSIGYSHPIKFNKMFQKHFGITPKKYQLNNLRK